jgi:hypothetical protein
MAVLIKDENENLIDVKSAGDSDSKMVLINVISEDGSELNIYLNENDAHLLAELIENNA